MKFDLVVELYMDGYPISAISAELMISSDKVLEVLRDQKKKESHVRGYTHDFKRMVAERIVSGVKKASVKEELGIAYTTINKYLKEFLVEAPISQKSLEENMYDEIDWTLFDKCPCCHGINVNDLNIYRQEGFDRKHSYCLTCGTEWEEKDGNVYKINWEYVE